MYYRFIGVRISISLKTIRKHTLKFWKPKRGGRANILNLLETAQQASSTAGYPSYASISCKHTQYDNKFDYKPDENSYPHFSIFTPASLLPFWK